jgi:hypothetical protein
MDRAGDHPAHEGVVVMAGMGRLMDLRQTAEYFGETVTRMQALKFQVPRMQIGRRWWFDRPTLDEWRKTNSLPARRPW